MIKGKSRVNGLNFEKYIELSCMYYKQKRVALIQKTPEPMKPISRIRRKTNQFVAIYEKKAQPDFAGTLKGGKSIVFEAKHTDSTNIAFDRLNYQQLEDLEHHTLLGAETFILISFGAKRFYKVTFDQWMYLAKTVNKKSLNEKDLMPYEIKVKNGIIDFL